MMDLAVLAGFARCIPDVHTFIVPVFMTGAGEYVAQHDPTGHDVVAGFKAISIDKGFDRVSFEFCARPGNAMLHGFELSDEQIVIGHAPLLCRFLQQRLCAAPDYTQMFPQTAAAIQRFIEFAQHCGRDGDSAAPVYLFEMERSHRDGVYFLHSLSTAAALAAGTPQHLTPTRWQNEVLHHLGLNHGRDGWAHQAAMNMLGSIARNALYPGLALQNLSKALGSVLNQCHVADGVLMTPSGHGICANCLFQLLEDNPSSVALQALLTFAERLVKLPAPIQTADAVLYMSALEAVHVHVTKHKNNTKQRAALERHVSLLERLEQDARHGARVREMLIQLKIRPDPEALAEYFAFMQSMNENFVAVIRDKVRINIVN